MPRAAPVYPSRTAYSHGSPVFTEGAGIEGTPGGGGWGGGYAQPARRPEVRHANTPVTARRRRGEQTLAVGRKRILGASLAEAILGRQQPVPLRQRIYVVA